MSTTDEQRIYEIARELNTMGMRIGSPEREKFQAATDHVEDAAMMWCRTNNRVLSTWLTCASQLLTEVAESLSKDHDA